MPSTGKLPPGREGVDLDTQQPCGVVVQGSPKECYPGLVNFVIAVAYHFCLNLPGAFSQTGKHSFGDPCRVPASRSLLANSLITQPSPLMTHNNGIIIDAIPIHRVVRVTILIGLKGVTVTGEHQHYTGSSR